MRITIQITLAVVILIAGIFIGRKTVNNEKVTGTETKLTDSTELLPAFKETKIGNQIWMVENLNVETFQNGDSIPEAKTIEEWDRLGQDGQPAWCYYDNDPKNGEKYGKLYNWYAVNDPRGLAPEGYHIPSKYEWEELVSAMGGEDVAGKKMKTKTGWIVPKRFHYHANENANGSNDFGLTVFPSGRRIGCPGNDVEFDFVDIYSKALFWSSNEGSSTFMAFSLHLSFDNWSSIHENSKSNGLSVRCIKDSEPEK